MPVRAGEMRAKAASHLACTMGARRDRRRARYLGLGFAPVKSTADPASRFRNELSTDGDAVRQGHKASFFSPKHSVQILPKLMGSVRWSLEACDPNCVVLSCNCFVILRARLQEGWGCQRRGNREREIRNKTFNAIVPVVKC
jgi:hypothetical protein